MRFLLHLIELFEQPVQMLRGDSHAGVLHAEQKRAVVAADPQRDRSLFRELDRVAEQVDENLPDLVAVGSDRRQMLFQIER